MYLVSKSYGEEARRNATLKPPFGPGFNSDGIERLEVWGTTVNDPGPDHCDFLAYDKDGKLLRRYTMQGY